MDRKFIKIPIALFIGVSFQTYLIIAYALGYDPLPFMPNGSLRLALFAVFAFCGWDLVNFFFKIISRKK